MTNRLIIIFLFFSSIGFAQADLSKEDSIQFDSLTMILEKLAREWIPENEPWTFISFEIKELELTVKYGQQSIHPFLAEYNRKIQFITKHSTSDTIDMAINSGGRTLIKVFF